MKKCPCHIYNRERSWSWCSTITITPYKKGITHYYWVYLLCYYLMGSIRDEQVKEPREIYQQLGEYEDSHKKVLFLITTIGLCSTNYNA